MPRPVGTDREYLETQYADFWKDQTQKYGICIWEQRIIDEILQCIPKTCFEVGIGTGYPIATSLKEQGVEVDGCDVADTSVKEACERLEREYNKQIFTGDLLELDINGPYDLVYCVRSSWYMDTDHFLNVLGRMIDIACSDGTIIFDYMDSAYRHMFVLSAIKGFVFSFPGKIYKCIFKHKKMYFFKEKYHDKETIESFLKKIDVDIVKTVREMDVLEPESGIKSAKVMYVLKKNKEGVK